MEDTPELRLGVRCVLLQLFEHNEKAYRAAVQMMEECGKAAIVHPTGTGKSYIAFKLIEEHQKKYGDLNIPAKYKTDEGFWLGRWWYLQKKLLREGPGKLKPEQVEKLKEVLEGERKKALPESA